MNTGCQRGKSVLRRLGETTLEEFLFYAAFTLFSIAEVVQTTAFTERYSVLNAACRDVLILAAVMLAFRVVLLRESGWQWMVRFVGFGVIAVIFVLKSFDTVFWLFLFVFAGKNADLNKLAKITLLVVSIITVISVMACYAGVIKNYVLFSSDRGSRSAMGFRHPNRLAERVSEICIAYWYLNSVEHRWRVIALNIAALLFVGYVAGSRGSSVIFAALILAVFIFPILSRFPKISAGASFILIIGIAALSFYLMVEYTPDNAFMSGFNQLLSLRLSLMNQSYEFAGLTLFGADFAHAPVVGTHYLYGTDVHFLVDNSYARILLYNGISASILLFVLIAVIYLRHIKEQRFSLALLGLTIVLAFGFVENYMLDIQYNYFMFLASGLLFAPSPVNQPLTLQSVTNDEASPTSRCSGETGVVTSTV